MDKNDLGVFESMGAKPEDRTERDFVMGTLGNSWRERPVGLRIDVVRPREIGDEPRMVGILLWNAQIRVVWNGGEAESVKDIFAGYDFFPYSFTGMEIIRLEDQFIHARAEYRRLLGMKSIPV